MTEETTDCGALIAAHRADPQFPVLEAELAAICQKQEEMWQTIVDKFPLPKGRTWFMSATGRLGVTHDWTSAEDSDYDD